MAPKVLYRVCYGTSHPTIFQKSLLKIRPAVLHSYCRRKVQGCDYPAIIPSPGSSVRGTYVQGLTEGDLWRLNIFEGEDYKREGVRVRLLGEVGSADAAGNMEHGEVAAEAYVWIAGEDELEDGEWDFAEFQREKMGRWIGGSEEFEGESTSSILGG